MLPPVQIEIYCWNTACKNKEPIIRLHRTFPDLAGGSTRVSKILTAATKEEYTRNPADL